MAQNVTKGPREEPLTDDTMNSNASPTENKKEEKQEKTMAILKKKEVKVKPKLISLKCVKTPTPPASVTKAVAVGLRRSPSNVEGASSDLQKELSVARPKWKSTASQSSSQKPSPRHHNVTHSKSSHEKKTQSIQKEGANKSPSVRKSELEKVSLSRRTEHIESVAATPANGKAPAYDHFDHFDPFERRVFKLKLQEADADEKLSGKFQSEAQRALYERRFYKMGLERTRLENEDFERFEQLYATTKVSGVALKRYQDNRDFAWRVMCFKQRQAALQQQKDLFVSEEVTREKWRQLDEDREKLMTENAHMFHTVMMENDGEFQRRDNAGKRGIGHGNQREEPKFKRRASNVNQSDATTSSRVIVGAALQLQGDGTRSKTFDPLRARPKNSPCPASFGLSVSDSGALAARDAGFVFPA
ncbi:hypothetical protein PInf_004969 [Phytophthora infestans]|nr:hypothetical protein PInf_004969 [Phytophthora infestans]